MPLMMFHVRVACISLITLSRLASCCWPREASGALPDEHPASSMMAKAAVTVIVEDRRLVTQILHIPLTGW